MAARSHSTPPSLSVTDLVSHPLPHCPDRSPAFHDAGARREFHAELGWLIPLRVYDPVVGAHTPAAYQYPQPQRGERRGFRYLVFGLRDFIAGAFRAAQSRPLSGACSRISDLVLFVTSASLACSVSCNAAIISQARAANISSPFPSLTVVAPLSANKRRRFAKSRNSADFIFSPGLVSHCFPSAFSGKHKIAEILDLSALALEPKDPRLKSKSVS